MYNYDPYRQFRQDAYNAPSPIQNISQTMTTQAKTYFVNSAKDMEQIQPDINVMYIGINKEKNEIYLRQINNTGLIDFSTYSLITGEKQKNDFAKIMERIDTLETKLNIGGNNVPNHTTNDANGNANAHVGQTQQPSLNATI